MANKIKVEKDADGDIVITISSDVSPLLIGMRLSTNDARLLRNKIDMILNAKGEDK